MHVRFWLPEPVAPAASDAEVWWVGVEVPSLPRVGDVITLFHARPDEIFRVDRVSWDIASPAPGDGRGVEGQVLDITVRLRRDEELSHGLAAGSDEARPSNVYWLRDRARD